MTNKHCSTNTVKQNLDESNQTGDDESYKQLPKRQKQNKKESKWKKADIDSAHDIADTNELPAELSDSIKTPSDAFCNIYSDNLLDVITTHTNIYANEHKGLNPPATSEEDQGCYQHFAIVWLLQGTLLWAALVYVITSQF